MIMLLSCAFGALCALPLIFPSLFFLPVIALSVFFCIFVTMGYRYRDGIMFTLGYFLVGSLFVLRMYPLSFAGLSKPAALLICIGAYILLSVISALFLSIFVPICRLAYPLSSRLGNIGEALCFGAAFASIEALGALLPFSLSLEPLSITLVGCLPFIQSASLFGSAFVTFLLVFVSALFSFGFLSMDETKEKKRTASKRYRKLVPGETVKRDGKKLYRRKNSYVVAAALIITASYIFGFLSMSMTETGETKKVSIIQANIGTTEKWGGESAEDALADYLELSAYASEGNDPEIIVWPETALPVDLGYYESYAAELEEFSSASDASLIIGAFSKETEYDEEENRIEHLYNSVYFVNDGELSEQTVSKKKLVPFGEYSPLGLFPSLNLSGTSLESGSDNCVADCSGVTVGGLICYDTVYPSVARKAVSSGAKALFILSNDSWYGEQGSSLLLRIAQLRAVENGRSTVRAASTGISAFISEKGVILDSLSYGEDSYIEYDLPICEGRTVYSVIGESFAVLCGAFLLVSVLYGIITEKRNDEAIDL